MKQKNATKFVHDFCVTVTFFLFVCLLFSSICLAGKKDARDAKKTKRMKEKPKSNILDGLINQITKPTRTEPKRTKSPRRTQNQIVMVLKVEGKRKTVILW